MGVTYSSTVAPTYEAIASITSTGSTSIFDFTSIPSTYTDLILVYNGTMSGSTNNGIRLRMNNDAGSNYDITRVYAAAGGTGSDNNTTNTFIDIGYMIAGTIETFQCHINNYTNSSIKKTVVSHFAAPTNDGTMQQAATWRSTAAINQVTLDSSINHVSGTTATLYGIKAG